MFQPIHNKSKEKLTSYEEAIFSLNGLQGNSAKAARVRQEVKRDRKRAQEELKSQLSFIGLNQDDISNLKVIHVAGTKGKGSTCAFTEAILRVHGLKTGLFSSPHLIEVRERIRINGDPLSKDQFVRYFWDVYNKLKIKEDILLMPGYFAFLSLMAYHTFIQEQVDVAIIEVGIGGEYDSTNIIEKPAVIGISSLGIDHTGYLGKTIEEIAWHKAGIFKPNIPSFSVPQPKEGMQILRERAYAIKAPLFLALPLELYEWEDTIGPLGIEGAVQKCNASLAIQLACTWLNGKEDTNEVEFNSSKFSTNEDLPLPSAPLFTISRKFAEGLANCRWPGRCQTVICKQTVYCLDGAHTKDSILNCAEWFGVTAQRYPNLTKVLVFNCVGGRHADILLSHLCTYNFNIALFSPNSIDTVQIATSDQAKFKADYETADDGQLDICISNLNLWNHMTNDVPCESRSFPCLRAACDYLTTLPPSLVLVTGSLKLVGAVLSLVAPESVLL
ncbi:FPGS [Cordylochernes scorpioides]|uniref:Folylpolyglutamate synthase n=1 Tax=Cordylochernes scorpioides TaxID=51811 RepID=A0ABY6LMT6_9ARAC|nr:FPGS [Cordylochernes scorpioides]